MGRKSRSQRPNSKGQKTNKKVNKDEARKSPTIRRRHHLNREEQYKFADYLQTFARNSAEFWYKDIWKTVGKCVLCDLRKRYVIKEIDKVILTTNIYPYITGHLMIVPRRHITHLKELTPGEWETVRMLYYVARKMLKDLLGIRSAWLIYREGALGESSEKTVEHLHIHVLPYEQGLVEWNYKKITLTAFDVAALFKRNNKTMDNLVERYRKKYQKKNAKSKTPTAKISN